jgi:hypothetical protein
MEGKTFLFTSLGCRLCFSDLVKIDVFLFGKHCAFLLWSKVPQFFGVKSMPAIVCVWRLQPSFCN